MFPGSTGAAREAYFPANAQPTGVNQFLSKVMNYIYSGTYAAAGYMHGPDTDNAMFYKKSTISYLARKQIIRDLRDISGHKTKVILGLGLNSEFRIYDVDPMGSH